MVFVGSDIFADEGERCRHKQDLQHEVVQGFKKDLAEGLGYFRGTIIVSKKCCSVRERVARDALGYIHFKLVTDAFGTCITRE